MFQHILMPLDFSEQSESAIDLASGLAAQHASRLTLLHVIEIIESGADEEVGDFYRSLETRARRMLTRLQTDLANRHVAAEIAITVGNRAQEIVRFADEVGVDLIVMSSRRVDPDTGGPSPWPTISHKVAVLAACPILLVR